MYETWMMQKKFLQSVVSYILDILEELDMMGELAHQIEKLTKERIETWFDHAARERVSQEVEKVLVLHLNGKVYEQ